MFIAIYESVQVRLPRSTIGHPPLKPASNGTSNHEECRSIPISDQANRLIEVKRHLRTPNTPITHPASTYAGRAMSFWIGSLRRYIPYVQKYVDIIVSIVLSNVIPVALPTLVRCSLQQGVR